MGARRERVTRAGNLIHRSVHPRVTVFEHSRTVSPTRRFAIIHDPRAGVPSGRDSTTSDFRRFAPMDGPTRSMDGRDRARPEPTRSTRSIDDDPIDPIDRSRPDRSRRDRSITTRSIEHDPDRPDRSTRTIEHDPDRPDRSTRSIDPSSPTRPIDPLDPTRPDPTRPNASHWDRPTERPDRSTARRRGDRWTRARWTTRERSTASRPSTTRPSRSTTTDDSGRRRRRRGRTRRRRGRSRER